MWHEYYSPTFKIVRVVGQQVKLSLVAKKTKQLKILGVDQKKINRDNMYDRSVCTKTLVF